MKNRTLYFAVGALSFVALAGCAPKLATTQYGPVENHWQSYVKQSYRDWNPPVTPPPAYGQAPEQGELSSVTPVPEASADNLSSISTIQPIVTDVKVNKLSVPTAVKEETYIVKKGDSLWSISKKFYNNTDGIKKIKEANHDILGSSEVVKVGMKLRIPMDK